MTDLFLLVLGVAWVLVLWPAALHARRSAPLSTVTRFRKRMNLIAPRAARAGRWVLTPRSPAPDGVSPSSTARVLRRRKRMFVALLLAAPLTAAAGLTWPPTGWLVHAAADIALLAYAVFLVASRRRRQAAARVRELRGRPPELDFTASALERRRA